ncbi:VOC family protein [Pseudonocardia sp. S2-4]|uniref:VOC family protein n=1 Tax=Pseudonocardia humida TaxID=2800819 RepID=A0ABT1ABU2_9PSEU|nr:VOC family protein [Pseudonocardia humida]
MLDHLVYAAPDLAAAQAAFAAATGLTPAPGGRHLGRGTRNLLVGLGPTAYLEIIGPDDEHPADPGAAVPFGVDALTAPRLVTWAARPDDIAAAAAASAAAGADLGPVAPMSRRTADGDLLEWRLAAPHPPPFDGVTPFLIDWGATAHPAASGLPAAALRGLRATHPDPEAVGAVLGALGLRLDVAAGPPGLAALLGTPRGPVVLA